MLSLRRKRSCRAYDNLFLGVQIFPTTAPSFVLADADAVGSPKLRTYDLSITYDKYYKTPRLWLFGYDCYGRPLESKEIFQDVLSEYHSKTVTVDPHPLTSVPTCSIHPCKVQLYGMGTQLQCRGEAPRIVYDHLIFSCGPAALPCMGGWACKLELGFFFRSCKFSTRAGPPTKSSIINYSVQHAVVMKRVIDDWREQGLVPRHDLALFVFLKFISSVVPTIDYDFTMDIEL